MCLFMDSVTSLREAKSLTPNGPKLTCPFYRWENGGPEQWCDFFKDTHLASVRIRLFREAYLMRAIRVHSYSTSWFVTLIMSQEGKGFHCSMVVWGFL